MINRPIVDNAFTREQNWRRRKAFVAFLNSIYGSADAQARQQRLPMHERKEKEVTVQSTKPSEWRVITKVLCVPEMCREIAAYL